MADGAEEEELCELGPACGTVLAASVGREELAVALARADGRLIKRETAKLYVEPPRNSSQDGPEKFKEVLASLFRACLEGDHAPVVAVAVAWHGRVDPSLNEGRGDPHKRSYYKAWKKEGVSLAALVREAMDAAGVRKDLPVDVVNDADAGMMALAHATLEDRRELKGTDDLPGVAEIQEMIAASQVTLGVTIAGGVGGALMFAPKADVRRSVERGSHGFVGELGQIPINVLRADAEKANDIDSMVSLQELKENKDFPKWKCTYRETLDHYASGRSIVEQLYPKRLDGGYNGRIRVIHERLDMGEGDAELQHVMDRAGRLIGQGLIGPTLMVDPDLIVISSFAYSPDLLTGVKHVLSTSAVHVGLKKQRMVLAPGDPDRTLKGAARWAIEARISPVLEEVCKTGNSGLDELKAKLLDGADIP
ncbi:MAG TPA: ROK family protein [Solirubrobacterales bacterium]|nr:ROK family protein [Solirubrobacterales bacterium]